jgi:transposase-like protein
MSLKKDNVIEEVMELLIEYGPEKFKESVELIFNQAMQIERSQVLQAQPYERNEERLGYANGFKPKKYSTSLGKLDLQIPQVRGDISFYPSSLEKGCRSEKALKLALAEMYIQGVSTRKVKAITEQLCGTSISSTQVSRLSAELDISLNAFRERELKDPYTYVYLDARYEKIRHNGCIKDMAILIALGVNARSGKREILGVSAKLSEAEVHWRHFMQQLQKRGLHGVKLLISDDHSGLRAARKTVFPSILWQRCQFHFQQNAQSYAPKRYMKKELADAVKYIFNSASKEEAIAKCKTISTEYETTAPEFCEWLEENIEETLTIFNFPKPHRRRIRTSNPLERLNQEIRRRTRVARLFPNEASCLRLVTAILVEHHENWVTGKKYLNFEIDTDNLNMNQKPFYRRNVA